MQKEKIPTAHAISLDDAIKGALKDGSYLCKGKKTNNKKLNIMNQLKVDEKDDANDVHMSGGNAESALDSMFKTFVLNKVDFEKHVRK